MGAETHQLLDLPRDVLHTILSHVRGVDLAKLSQVCQGLRDMCSSPELWRKACQKEPRFPTRALARNKRLQRRTAAEYWRLSYRLFYLMSTSGRGNGGGGRVHHDAGEGFADTVICPGCLRTVAVASQDHLVVPLCVLWNTCL